MLALFAGCGSDPALEAQRERLEREHLARMADLERLEARLVRSIGTIRLWEELGRRHGEVSALACENAAQHAEEMVALSRRFYARSVDTRLAHAGMDRETAASN